MTGSDTAIVNITFPPDISHIILGSVTLLVEFEAINLAIGKLTGQYLKNWHSQLLRSERHLHIV